MMGILTSVGSLSRAFGPVTISILYSAYGPRISFGALGIVVLLANVVIVLTFKRYEPYKYNLYPAVQRIND